MHGGMSLCRRDLLCSSKVKDFPSRSPATVDPQLDLLRVELDQQRALMQGAVVQF